MENPTQSTLPDRRELAIVCAFPREAAAIAACMQQASRTHFGLFRGYLGKLAGLDTALAISAPGEAASYAALRQIAFLFQPRWAFNFGVAGAVRENLHVGDVVLVNESLRYYAPCALASNVVLDDGLIFPDAKLRSHILDAPAQYSSPGLLEAATETLQNAMPHSSLQSSVPRIRIGCSDRPLLGSRARRFVRERYRVDAVDMESYGFLSACRDTALPGLSLKILSDACSEDAYEVFQRNARQLLQTGAEALKRAVEGTVASQSK